MEFEFFKGSGRSYVAKASIRKQGQIGLSQGAINRYKIQNDQFVLLAYSAITGTVGIKLLNQTEEGAKCVKIAHGSGTIAAKAFLDYFGIPYAESRTFDIQEDTENGLLVFNTK